MMMIAPATTLNTVRCESRKLPTHVAEAPRAMNTIEKPATNAIEFRKMRATSGAPPPAFSASIDSPESMEMYPGTSGSTQGDRNEATPARNAIGMLS